MNRVFLFALLINVSSAGADTPEGLQHIIIELEGRINPLPRHTTEQTYHVLLRSDSRATVTKLQRDKEGYLISMGYSQFWKMDKKVYEGFVHALLLGVDFDTPIIHTHKCHLRPTVKATVVWHDGERIRSKRIQIVPTDDGTEAYKALFDGVILIDLYYSLEARFLPIPNQTNATN